ncbi:MAG: YfcE family phosphodiesterase, partial [Haloarculaceae archaeon]
MLAVIADTHGTDDPRLAGRAAEAVEAAEAVLHAGDFTTQAVYDAFELAAEPGSLHAVAGNRDDPALRQQLPATATVEALDRRFVLAHGHEHDRTALSLLARQEEADCVIVGHSHRYGIADLGEVTLVNPGSHADPRGGPAT